MLRTTLLWAAAGLIVVVIVLAAVYLRDINRAYARVQAKSIVIASPYGNIECNRSRPI
jgi:hypothetical protein